MLREKINNLLKVVNEEDLWLIKNSLESIFDYMQLDAKIEAELRGLKTRNYDPEVFAEERERLAAVKYNKEKSTIISVRILNRLSRLYNVEKIYTGEDNDESILEFAGKIVEEYYGVYFSYPKSLSA